MILDPDAEALVRLLFRLRLDPSRGPDGADARGRQLSFVREAVSDMLWSLAEEQKNKIYVALAALHPDQGHWSSYGETPPAELLRVRRMAYEQRRTPEALEALIRLLDEAEAETLDKAWIESLARAHPERAELQRLLATVAPERAAQVFAEGGLTRRERELLIDVVGQKDVAEAARMARELLLESFEVEHLVSALGYDPEGTARFLAARRGDPRWEELGAMARLKRVYENSDDTAQIVAEVERSWRQLSPQRLPEVLEMLEDASWTPVEREILDAILASGDEDMIDNVGYLAPPEVQWKLRARTDRLEGEEFDVEIEVERFLEFLNEVPFTARASLEDLYRVVPRPGERGAFRLAESFQSKGDPETAKAILERAPAGRLTEAAQRQLKAGLSLEDLDADELAPMEDD